MGSCMSQHAQDVTNNGKTMPQKTQMTTLINSQNTASWRSRRRQNFISLVLPRHHQASFPPVSPVSATHSPMSSSPHSTHTSPQNMPLEPNDTDDSTLDQRIYAWLPQINHPRFGCLQNKLPLIKRFMVDANENQCADVGCLVHKLLFSDEIGYPEGFVANITSAVGDFSIEGTYCNPQSIWFNVSLGFYEIVAPITEDNDEDVDWHRPFGYEEDCERIRTEDVLRLLLADWNFFTAYLYGVPLSECQKALPDRTKIMEHLEKRVHVSPKRVKMGKKYFDEITFTQVPCVSTYQSKRQGAARLVPNSGLTALWQEALGLPSMQETSNFPDSFTPCKMSGTMWMSWKRKRDGFHTVMIGGGFMNETVVENGVVSQEENKTFLDVQRAASKRTIELHYSDLGFDKNLDHSMHIENIKIDEK